MSGPLEPLTRSAAAELVVLCCGARATPPRRRWLDREILELVSTMAAAPEPMVSEAYARLRSWRVTPSRRSAAMVSSTSGPPSSPLTISAASSSTALDPARKERHRVGEAEAGVREVEGLALSAETEAGVHHPRPSLAP